MEVVSTFFRCLKLSSSEHVIHITGNFIIHPSQADGFNAAEIDHTSSTYYRSFGRYKIQ